MKILCETTGNFMLVDFHYGGSIIESGRPSVVIASSFYNARAAAGQVKIFGEVSNEATDQEFEKYLIDSDNDVELAINSFMSTYGKDASTSKNAAPEKRKPTPTK